MSARSIGEIIAPIVADAVGLSATTVARHLRALEELGFLRRGRATRPVDVRMFLPPAEPRRADPATVAVPGTDSADTTRSPPIRSVP